MKRIKLYRFVCWLTLLTAAPSCEELVEVGPPHSEVPRAAVFEDDLLAIAAISGLYSTMAFNGFYHMTYPASLSADDLMVEGGITATKEFYQNEVSPINPTIEAIWRAGYTTIYNANSIIEGLANSGNVSADLKAQLMGEAKFFRAFSHFYLMNLFGEVPYISVTDYRVNRSATRMSIPDLYEKIIADLAEARTLLSEDYSYAKNERVRVNKWAATAMLARVYLFQKDWIRAEEQASRVIDNTALFGLTTTVGEVFFKNSRETIWQLIPTYPQKYTTEGYVLNRSSYSPDNLTIPDELFNAFETGDQRKAQWIGVGVNSSGNSWHYPLKYKETFSDTVGADEYSMALRLAEQYLIRAEARAKQGKLVGLSSAQSDINIIRSRAGLPNTTATALQDLLGAIEQERRVELFTEWGHRWLDLKRTGRAIPVLSLVKPQWQNTDVLYPIPDSELQLNPNLK